MKIHLDENEIYNLQGIPQDKLDLLNEWLLAEEGRWVWSRGIEYGDLKYKGSSIKKGKDSWHWTYFEYATKTWEGIFTPQYKKGDYVICGIDNFRYIVELSDVDKLLAVRYITIHEDYYSEVLKGGKFDEIIRYATEDEIKLFTPQLKVGDTFEHEGFICRVEKPIIIMPKFVSSQNGIKRIKNEHQYKALKNSGWIDVTDTEFIKQLEKHSK